MEHMPVLFVGHGSPMNAIEDNRFSAQWKKLAERIPRPEAILSVSAHWYTAGLRVSDDPAPRLIYDMYGFPKELYEVRYDAPGAPHFAGMTKQLLGVDVRVDDSWGLDHGTWSVLCHVYPQADIPVFQLSVDNRASAEEHYNTGRKLRALRDRGVLLFGSGNVVHNLSRVNWAMEDTGYPWAEEFDGYIKENVLSGNHDNIFHYRRAGDSSKYAFTYFDHFAPFLCALGASEPEDEITVFNEACVLGSLSMTSYLFG